MVRKIQSSPPGQSGLGHTLALAFFGEDNLPDQLVDIPLEYFQGALSWLAGQERVRDDSIIVLGNSKGGEAAILQGKIDDRVAGVIGIAPSSVVLQGLVSKAALPVEKIGDQSF